MWSYVARGRWMKCRLQLSGTLATFPALKCNSSHRGHHRKQSSLPVTDSSTWPCCLVLFPAGITTEPVDLFSHLLVLSILLPFKFCSSKQRNHIHRKVLKMHQNWHGASEVLPHRKCTRFRACTQRPTCSCWEVLCTYLTLKVQPATCLQTTWSYHLLSTQKQYRKIN